jgi:hypothetical protein
MYKAYNLEKNGKSAVDVFIKSAKAKKAKK